MIDTTTPTRQEVCRQLWISDGHKKLEIFSSYAHFKIVIIIFGKASFKFVPKRQSYLTCTEKIIIIYYFFVYFFKQLKYFHTCQIMKVV
jgi:hypothetical protein